MENIVHFDGQAQEAEIFIIIIIVHESFLHLPYSSLYFSRT